MEDKPQAIKEITQNLPYLVGLSVIQAKLYKALYDAMV